MWRIDVKGRPPSLNDWYGSGSWRRRHAQKAQWGPIFFYAIKESKLPKLKSVHVSVTQFCKGRARDADNVVPCAKLFLDALVDAGNLPDDSPEYVRSVTLASRKGREDRVVVAVAEAGPDPEQDGAAAQG